MVIRDNRIKTLLQNVSAKSENPWTVWTGASAGTAAKLVNDDGSNVYVCKVNVPTLALATLTNMTVNTEFFEVLWVTTRKPDPDTGWFLSLDDGATKDRVNFLTRESRVKNTYWSVILRNG